MTAPRAAGLLLLLTAVATAVAVAARLAGSAEPPEGSPPYWPVVPDAAAAFMTSGPVEWFDWQYGFVIAAGIYFAGFLVSLLIPGKPRAPEAVA